MITIKNKYLWMVLIALLSLLPLHAQHRIARKAKAKAATEQKAKTLNQIFKVNDYWQKNHTPDATAFWNVAAYHTGNMEVCKWLTQELSSNKKLSAKRRKLLTDKLNAYLAYSLRWAEHNQWKGATEADTAKWLYKKYGEDQQHVLFGDWQICFQTYIDLYNMFQVQQGSKGQTLTKMEISSPDLMTARAKEVMGYVVSHSAHDYWWWADALYMVMPVMMKMYKLTGDVRYLDKLYDNICYSDSIMLDKETGLYFRDGKYIYPMHKTNSGKKDFWARGDGWVLAGLAKVLQDMPKSYRHYDFFLKKYQRLALAVAEIQQPEGYWTRSMMDPQQAPGPETSGTAFFTYGMEWGVNHGLLNAKTFKPVIRRAQNYLTTVALQSDGSVGYVQPIGERAIPGQHVDKDSQADFGVGAFLLAATESLRRQYR